MKSIKNFFKEYVLISQILLPLAIISTLSLITFLFLGPFLIFIALMVFATLFFVTKTQKDKMEEEIYYVEEDDKFRPKAEIEDNQRQGIRPGRASNIDNPYEANTYSESESLSTKNDGFREAVSAFDDDFMPLNEPNQRRNPDFIDEEEEAINLGFELKARPQRKPAPRPVRRVEGKPQNQRAVNPEQPQRRRVVSQDNGERRAPQRGTNPNRASAPQPQRRRPVQNSNASNQRIRQPQNNRPKKLSYDEDYEFEFGNFDE